MDVKELRLGNLVWDDYSGVMIVSSICSNGNDDEDYVFLKKNTKYPSGMYCCEDIEPIPLTEEWLLNLGFEQNGDISYKLRETGFVILVFGGIFKHNVTGKEFKYVHKLQNFYYELNDKELTLKQNG